MSNHETVHGICENKCLVPVYGKDQMDEIIEERTFDPTGNYQNVSVGQATNAIKKSDETYEGFTKDANDILKVGDEIVPRLKVLWSGHSESATGQAAKTITLSEDINGYDTLIIEWMLSTTSRRPVTTIMRVNRDSMTSQSLPIVNVPLLGNGRLQVSVQTSPRNTLVFAGFVHNQGVSGIEVTRIMKVVMGNSWME